MAVLDYILKLGIVSYQLLYKLPETFDFSNPPQSLVNEQRNFPDK